jgi:hypothetical protein
VRQAPEQSPLVTPTEEPMKKLLLPGPAIATEVPMDIPAGGHQVVVWPEYVSGPLQVSAYADWTHVVPEYNENNNSASLTVYP